MVKSKIYKELPMGHKRKGHRRLRSVGKKVLHIGGSFMIGVAIAAAVHFIVTNHKVRITAEAVCNVYSKDTNDCKANIDNILDMVDNNTSNIKPQDLKPGDWIQFVGEGEK